MYTVYRVTIRWGQRTQDTLSHITQVPTMRKSRRLRKSFTELSAELPLSESEKTQSDPTTMMSIKNHVFK